MAAFSNNSGHGVSVPPAPISCLKTRMAPTPSGFLHLGNILSFVLTATLAEHYNARTLLRIDDLDRQRVRDPYVQDIFDTLHFLDLPWQEGPADAADFEQHYSQLHRLELYKEALTRLRAENLLFACDCSRSTLAGMNDGYNGKCLHKKLSLDEPGVCWRLRTDEPLLFKVRTQTSVLEARLPAEQRYFIVRKKDGYPAYQLSSLVDDLHFNISLIVRGADLWQSTLAQLYLARTLRRPSFEQTVFFHHPLLTNTSGIKLSKSAGDTSLLHLRSQGCDPADIFLRIAQEINPGNYAANWHELGALLLSQLPEFHPPGHSGN